MCCVERQLLNSCHWAQEAANVVAAAPTAPVQLAACPVALKHAAGPAVVATILAAAAAADLSAIQVPCERPPAATRRDMQGQSNGYGPAWLWL